MPKKYPTSTLTTTNEIVPWLASSGPLSYTPENPPSRDYYFQYGWVMPEVLSPKANRKQHYFFGEGRREYAQEIFEFWKDARAGKARPIVIKRGTVTPLSVAAPIAVYHHDIREVRKPGYMLVQHGSYQYLPREEQPELTQGTVSLYRGIQKAETFFYRQFNVSKLKQADSRAWAAYLKTQAEILSDSVVSFNCIHDRAVRSETEQINDRSRMSDALAMRNGLNIEDAFFGEALWDNHHQCFALEQWVAERKFGPNYVICKTPVTNIRMTTFFAGEAEVKVVDPNKVRLVKAVGCRWEIEDADAAIRSEVSENETVGTL